MNIIAVTVMSLILTLTRYVDGAKGGCRAIKFDTYFLEGETHLPQNIADLSEIVYVPKRDAIYFRRAAFTPNYFNDTKIVMLRYSINSLAKEINFNGVRTFAYNDFDDNIYIGTNDGLYSIDSNHRISTTDIKDSVISIFIQNNIIYYVNGYNEVMVYDLSNPKNYYKMGLLDIAKLTRLVVNNNKDMVGITTNFDIMTLSHNNGLLFHKSDKLGRPINLSVDNDIVYVYTTNGVYKMNSKGYLDFVSNFGHLQGLAFAYPRQFPQSVITVQNGIISIRHRYNTDPCLKYNRKQ